MRTERQHNDRKKEIMEKCFDCYAENGLTGTGIKTLAKECGCTSGTLYVYFKNLDDLSLDKAFLREFVWCFSNNCVLLRPGSAALHPLV